ncbi:MAG: EamA family transporter, partial [Woeseiaceae bacterium]|nr:EamA family transporter [Woeseiaceae bacterium]
MSHTITLTSLAMMAFAANSVLCRLALGNGHIDAASFATIRVVAGAFILAVIVLLRSSGKVPRDADWRSALALYLYMVFFAFAYLTLAAGTGALILFGAVQLTMFITALRSGERFSPVSWAGLTLAIAGLVYLVSPGLAAPDPVGAMLMAIAGIAWGAYSLVGRSAPEPTRATAWNFLLSVPLVLMTSAVFIDDMDVSRTGIVLA